MFAIKEKQPIVFLFLAFPWIAMSADKLGWIFRISGATFTYTFFSMLGFPIEQQGTSIIVSGVLLSVDSACAGMNTLQAVLIMGFAVTYFYLRSNMNIALNIFLLTLLAWWTNALRIVIIGFAALTFGEEFALGLFHTWGSMILLTFMFLFTFALVHVQKYALQYFRQRTIIVIAFIYIVFNMQELLKSWWRSPLEQYGWLPLLLWLIPCVVHVYKCRGKVRAEASLLSLAVLTTFFGSIGDLNTLCYLGFAIFIFAMCAAVNVVSLLWGVCAITWMPAFSWLGSYYTLGYTFSLKVIITSIASLLMVKAPRVLSTDKALSSRMIAAYVVLFVITFMWPFLPYKTQQRLSHLPQKGFGFVSRDIPLSSQEQGSFGKAKVLKRLYRVANQSFVLLAIDGTKDRHAVHDPHYCIVGAGWRIMTTRQMNNDMGTMSWVKLQRGTQVKEVVYWFTAQSSIYTSPMRYWYETTLRRISLGYLYQEPVLVILQTLDGKTLHWQKIFEIMPQLYEF